jgi:predicted MPP superfamily phosphohydrolase
MSFMFYILGVMVLYLSLHIYYSFFGGKSILFIPPIIFISCLLAFSVLWLRSVSMVLPYQLYKIVQFATYFLLGIGLYAFTFYIIADLLRIFIKINPYKEGLVIFGLAFIVALLGYVNTRFIREVSYNISSSKLTKPLKVVLISDLHIGSPDMSVDKFKRMTKKINAQNPDVVIIAGDIVDDASIPYRTLGYKHLFKEIKAKNGVYATVGNHETYRGDVNEVIAKFNEDGLIVIENNQIYIKEYNLNLVGINDIGRAPKDNLMKAKDFNLQNSKFNLVIEHNPVRFSENYQHNVDLQVSGHTHAGQIIHGYILEHFLYEKPWGILNKENSALIVSSGIATWGPPIRDITYPEIVTINITPKAS